MCHTHAAAALWYYQEGVPQNRSLLSLRSCTSHSLGIIYVAYNILPDIELLVGLAADCQQYEGACLYDEKWTIQICSLRISSTAEIADTDPNRIFSCKEQDMKAAA